LEYVFIFFFFPPYCVSIALFEEEKNRTSYYPRAVIYFIFDY
jgi:hypothetical protein